MKLDLQSERFAATGNVTGQGARRSLGTPTLDALHILVRETTQNAWDARREGSAPVRLKFHLRELSAANRSALGELLEDLPPGGPTRIKLRESLNRESLRVLEVSDFETTGLGGPVRADAPVDEGQDHDFIDFFRNMGSARDRRLGGGTYGYGKSASYRLSRCATLLAYTQTSNAGRGTTRFMAASIGNDFQHQQRRYTGRHWWGERASDRVVDPLTGASAHRAAVSIGLGRRSATDTGTCLAILDPEIDPRTPLQAVNAIAESLIWFFWPKMIPGQGGQPAMNFELALDGQHVQMPGLESFPPIEAFVAAMNVLKEGGGELIRCEKPIQALGRIAFAKTPRRARVTLDTGDDRQLIPEFCSHVALMRPAELVVKYAAGPRLNSDRVEYGGVFICGEDVEQHFADAEPPAHDDWVPDYLEGRARTFVRVATRRINEATEKFAVPPDGGVRGPDQIPLAALGDALGGVLIGQTGSRVGGDRPPKPPPGGAKSRSFRIGQPEPFRFAVVRKTPCALFRVRIQSARRRSVLLEAKPAIVLEGGSMLEVSDGEGPEVVAWLDGSGRMLHAGSTASVDVNGEVALLIAVGIRPDSAVAVNVEALEGAD